MNPHQRRLRQDPFTGAWSAWEPGRRRPPGLRGGPCALCEGPGPVLGQRGAVWSTPAPVPAVGVEAGLASPAVPFAADVPGVGAHELLVEGPLHHHDPTLPHWPDALLLARERVRDLLGDQRLAAFALVRRDDPGGHPLTELLATSRVSDALAAAAARQACHPGPSLAAAVAAAELATSQRVVSATPHAVAVATFASPTPLACTVLPREASPCFSQATEDAVTDVARLAADLRRRLAVALPDQAVDLALHTGERALGKGWRVELVPRLPHPTLALAGLFHEDPVGAEHAAAWLRGL